MLFAWNFEVDRDGNIASIIYLTYSFREPKISFTIQLPFNLKVRVILTTLMFYCHLTAFYCADYCGSNTIQDNSLCDSVVCVRFIYFFVVHDIRLICNVVVFSINKRD